MVYVQGVCDTASDIRGLKYIMFKCGYALGYFCDITWVGIEGYTGICDVLTGKDRNIGRVLIIQKLNNRTQSTIPKDMAQMG